jgi:hypothetical protein
MPKFKVGDIVAITGSSGQTYEILDIGDRDYKVRTVVGNHYFTWLQSSCIDDELDHSSMAARQFKQELAELLEE